MFIKQLSVFVENKSGRLAEITALIAAAGVDLRAVSMRIRWISVSSG